MNIQHLLATVICYTFEAACGKWQMRKRIPMVFVVNFKVSLNPNEDGFRCLDLALYAPWDHVKVYARERWCVIPNEDLELDLDTDEMAPKPGKFYQTGEGPWESLGASDIGWTSLVHDFITKNGTRLQGFDNPSNFFRLMDPLDLRLP
jgi:hypothetical protein